MPSRTASQNSLAHPAIAIASSGQQIPQQQRAQQQQQQQQRSASPMSLASVANGNKQPSGLLKKKPPTTAPVALGILRALEPPRGSDQGHGHPGRGSQSEEYLAGSDSGHGQPAEKKEKRGFWGGSRDKDRDREREREREKEREREYALRERESLHRERVPDEGPAELTRMIGSSNFPSSPSHPSSFLQDISPPQPQRTGRSCSRCATAPHPARAMQRRPSVLSGASSSE